MSPQPRTTSSLVCHGWKNTIRQSALVNVQSPSTQPSARKSVPTMAVSSLSILNPNHPVPHRTSRPSGSPPLHRTARLLDVPCSTHPPQSQLSALPHSPTSVTSQTPNCLPCHSHQRQWNCPISPPTGRKPTWTSLTSLPNTMNSQNSSANEKQRSFHRTAPTITRFP